MLGDARMARQQLMTTLVGQNRFEGEILRIGVAIKRFGINGQQALFRRTASAVLRAARLAVNVPVLDASDKPQVKCDANRAIAKGPSF